jgi:4-hydroxybenzoate polyprenyltransferase
MSQPSAVPPFRRSAPAEGQTLTGESLLVRYVNFVKLPHTLFALPFALLGVLAAGSLNRLCLVLSPLALAWILTYSLAKRFTWWPHLWLGLSLAIAPVGGYLAVTGQWSQPPWPLVAVAGAVATWVAGFDIFYALPDEGFDRREGLRSAVVRLGESRAMLLAKLLHGVTIPALALFGYGMAFGPWYYAGLVAAAAILAYEHALVRPGDLSRLDAAFFTMNGIMSVTVFGFALIDRLAG